MNFIYFRFIFTLSTYTFCNAVPYIDTANPSNCLTSDSDNPKEFYDISQLKCSKCSQSAKVQTVSLDGLRCVCLPGFKIIKYFGGTELTCEKCPIGEESSNDGWQCLKCKNTIDGECVQCDTSNTRIAVERELNGEFIYGDTKRSCVDCSPDTISNNDRTRCLPCNQVMSMISNVTGCQCPTNQMTGGLCFQSPDDITTDTPALYLVKFDKNEFDSAYFFEHIRAAEAMCKPKYGNLTACQMLGNMCVLNLYRLAKDRDHNACDLYQTLTKESRHSFEWPPNMPWLYYEEDTGDMILTDINVREKFTFPNQRINLVAFTYSLNGTFLGKVDLSGSMLQLCLGEEKQMDAALNFGTTYNKQCELSVRNFWDENKYKMIFYDIFIQFDHFAKNRIYPIPILYTQYKNAADNAVNNEADKTRWKLTRRLFFVDNISGKEIIRNTDDNGVTTTEIASKARSIRYLSSLTLRIELRKGSKLGEIYPPYFVAKYSTATLQQYDNDEKVTVSMSVTYKMDLTSYSKSVELSMAILGIAGFANAVMMAYSWNRKASKIAMDFATITKFCVYLCSNLANVFFIVNIGVGLHWLIMFKKQSSVYLLLPQEEQEKSFIINIILAFCLKSISIFNLILEQTTINIFFVDWEKPKGDTQPKQKPNSSRHIHMSSKGDANKNSNNDQPINTLDQVTDVSIWRSCFVANEWNEIQTIRKVNPIVQIFLLIFFMNVLGFENIPTRDPYSTLTNKGTYRSVDSRILRFAVSSSLYICIAVVQWFLYTVVYQRFIEDVVRQFVDLCSVNNISIFMLDTSLHGFYIHGRSVHGTSDINMKELIDNLEREEEDLCGQRGLLPGTDQQTFEIFISRETRARYDRILSSITLPQNGPVAANTSVTSDVIKEKSIIAYSQLNRFLQNFIDHSIPELEYTVQDRLFVGNLLRIEFRETMDRGLFVNDDGHSFDEVLFFGSESILIPFEVMMFCLIDLIFGHFLFSALATLFFINCIAIFRNGLAESNLAKKTLIDRRFLI